MFTWITGLVESSGYFGVFILMLGENLFPPIPSELIMPLAGFIAVQGELNVVLVVVAGTLGSIVGALPWYYAGKLVGARRLRRWTGRHGRWFTLTPDDVDQAQGWFRRYGVWAVFLGRLVPAVRTLISVPAGIAEMPLPAFLAFTTVGTVIWTSALALAGYVLESQYEIVADYLDPVSTAVVVIGVGYYIYRVIAFKPATE